MPQHRLAPQSGDVVAVPAYTYLATAHAVKAVGAKPVPLCEPSQKGWFLLWPQAHQKYFFPASTSTA